MFEIGWFESLRVLDLVKGESNYNIPEMCVSSKALTLNPFSISSFRHSTCPPSAAEWTGFWPERRMALFVVRGIRVLRTLQRERGGGVENS